MRAITRKSLAVMAFAASVSAFAGAEIENRVSELEKKMDMVSTTTAIGTVGARTASARAEPDGLGWNLNFSVIYWQTKVGGSQYATSTNAVGSSLYKRDGFIKEPKFGWDFGFKIGAGYNFYHDGWELSLDYTYFRNKGDYNLNVALPSALFPIPGDALNVTAQNIVLARAGAGADFATSATTNIKSKFDDIKLELARDFFVSKYLSMSPNYGLRATWIRLNQNSKYWGGGTAYVQSAGGTDVTVNGLGAGTVYTNQSLHTFALGPKAGVGSRWHFGPSISMYGNIGAALMFGYQKGDDEVSYDLRPNNMVDLNYNFHRLIPNVEFELGLVYDKYIMNDTQHCSISLGYENQYFWNASYDETGFGTYGVTLKVRWDF